MTMFQCTPAWLLTPKPTTPSVSTEGENPMANINLTPEQLAEIEKMAALKVDENGNPIPPTEVTISQSTEDVGTV